MNEPVSEHIFHLRLTCDYADPDNSVASLRVEDWDVEEAWRLIVDERVARERHQAAVVNLVIAGADLGLAGAGAFKAVRAATMVERHAAA